MHQFDHPPMRVARASQFRAMPWKNGQGVTHEILREPAIGDAFAWRLSLATIERAGEFSGFPGCARTLLLVEGGGLALDFAEHGRRLIDTPHRPERFDGAWPARADLLGGPVRVLNLITSRSAIRPDVTVIDAAGRFFVERIEPVTLLVVCLSGSVSVQGDGAEPVVLTSLDAVRIDAAPRRALSVNCTAHDDRTSTIFLAGLSPN